jgi:hypothetical protein
MAEAARYDALAAVYDSPPSTTSSSRRAADAAGQRRRVRRARRTTPAWRAGARLCVRHRHACRRPRAASASPFWPFTEAQLREDLRAAGAEPEGAAAPADQRRYLVTALRSCQRCAG